MDVIDSDRDIGERSKCDMEDPAFLVDYEYIPNFHEED